MATRSNGRTSTIIEQTEAITVGDAITIDCAPPPPTSITADEHAYFAKAFADLEAAEKQAMEANAALRDAGAVYYGYGRHLSEKYGLVAGRDEINAPSGAIIYGKNSTP